MSTTIIPEDLLSNVSYCPAEFKRVCWPQTLVNQTVNISCVALGHAGVDSRNFFSRQCNSSGEWMSFRTVLCFHPDVVAVLNKSYTVRSLEAQKIFERIVRVLRYFEFAGLSISLTSILISLFIFFTFKSLLCNRTKIHINLLIAILIQIVARLAAYGVQMVQLKSYPKNECDVNGSLHPYPKSRVLDGICPSITILLQFGTTAMFMWMLCEGIRLNNVLTVGVFKNHFKTSYFYILGWAVPFCLTLSWTIVMFVKERYRKCFNNYMHLNYYWIIDGPRYAVIIINMILLLNIIRVLLAKIKEGSEKRINDDKRRGSSNANSVRKAVKAAIFLVPLLGITHVLETFFDAGDKPIAVFVIYSSVIVFMATLQGFFCSLLYCFLNAEVRETLSRRFKTTQIWYRWKKRYLGEHDQLQNGKIQKDNHTHLDNLTSPKKVRIEMEEHRLTADFDELN